MAGRWLLACPGPHTSLSSAVFRGALSAHLALPSPTVVTSRWVGKTVGRRGARIGSYRDEVVSSKDVPGDSWTHRHDSTKQFIVHEAILSGVNVKCEVCNVFSDILPAVTTEVGGALEYGRARQGLVLNLQICPAKPESPKLISAEIKRVGCCPTWYPAGGVERGTDCHAARLPGEYERSLKKYDVKYYGIDPEERRLVPW